MTINKEEVNTIVDTLAASCENTNKYIIPKLRILISNLQKQLTYDLDQYLSRLGSFGLRNISSEKVVEEEFIQPLTRSSERLDHALYQEQNKELVLLYKTILTDENIALELNRFIEKCENLDSFSIIRSTVDNLKENLIKSINDLIVKFTGIYSEKMLNNIKQYITTKTNEFIENYYIILRQARSINERTCEDIMYLYNKNVIHNDINNNKKSPSLDASIFDMPSNVETEVIRPKVVDDKLAKMLADLDLELATETREEAVTDTLEFDFEEPSIPSKPNTYNIDFDSMSIEDLENLNLYITNLIEVKKQAEEDRVLPSNAIL